MRRGSVTEALESLKTGDAEIAIAGAEDQEAGGLESWLLFDEGFLLSCSRVHRLANKASVGLSDLSAERFVLARHGEHAEALAALLRENKVRLERSHETFSDDDLKKLVADGAGVAIVPNSLGAGDGTTSMPVEGRDLRRSVYLFGMPGRPRSAAASTLINLLRAADWRDRAA